MNTNLVDPKDYDDERGINYSEPELTHYLTSDDEYLEPGCTFDYASN